MSPAISTDDETADALRNAGVIPAASYENETLLTAHRADDQADYYFIYNYGNANNYRDVQTAETVDTDVVLKGNGKPYLLNAWTGEVSAADFTESEEGIRVHVHLEPNDSVIFAISEDVLAADTATAAVMSEEIKVSGWNLKIESWTPGETVLDTVKTVVFDENIDTLKTWDQLSSDLKDVSGIGTYTASFETPESYEEGQQVWIHLGRNKDAYGILINGAELIADQASGNADVTSVLKKGTNEIEITVATSLLNAVLKNNSGILNDEGRVLDDRSPAAYGLRNEVTLSGSAYR